MRGLFQEPDLDPSYVAPAAGAAATEHHANTNGEEPKSWTLTCGLALAGRMWPHVLRARRGPGKAEKGFTLRLHASGS